MASEKERQNMKAGLLIPFPVLPPGLHYGFRSLELMLDQALKKNPITSVIPLVEFLKALRDLA